MAKVKRIKVRGRQRTDIDPMVFLQVLLSIAGDWDEPAEVGSVDAFDAAIEDHQAANTPRERSA